MTEFHLPAQAIAWLADAERALSGTDAAQKDLILDGLRSHITEALSRGEALDDVLTRLGPAAEIRDSAASDGPDARRRADADAVAEAPRVDPVIERYFTTRRALQLGSLLLALAAAVYISLQPGYVAATLDSTGRIVSETTALAFFTMGPKAAGTLIAAIALTAVPLFLEPRARHLNLAVALILVVLAVLSTYWMIGWFILPAALVSVIAATLRYLPRKPMAPRPEAAKT